MSTWRWEAAKYKSGMRSYSIVVRFMPPTLVKPEETVIGRGV